MEPDFQTVYACGVKKDSADHACEGPAHAHLGMWVTLTINGDSTPYRIIWLSQSRQTAVVMPHDLLAGNCKVVFAPGGAGLMIAQSDQGRWWVENLPEAATDPVKLGIGVFDLDF